MQKNTVWTIVIVVVLVVLGIILLSSPKEKAPEAVSPEVSEEGGVVPEGGVAIPEGGAAAPEVLEQAEAVVPEGSLVTKEGEVLTPTGEPTSNEALPGSPSAPKQSRALSESEIPADAIKLTVTASGFIPNEFTVKENAVVTFSVTSGDRTHVFKFDSPVMQGVAVGVASNETRAITFKAPAAGDYSFFCDVPGHRDRGETGVMHVK